MTRNARIRGALAAGVVVLGAAGYALFIPAQRAAADRLARLVEVKAPAGYTSKPSAEAALPLSDTPFAAAKQAAKRTPDGTGAYSVQWKGHGANKGAEAEILVVLLPSTADAKAVLKEAQKQYLGAKSLSSEGYALADRFVVAGVPGAKGATYKDTSSTSASRTTSAVVRRGSVVASFFAEATHTSTQRSVSALGREEYARLGTTEAGFSLATTYFPAEASALYGGVTVAVAACVLAVPVAVGRIRRRRARARAEAARRQRMARGQKVVRRQARRA